MRRGLRPYVRDYVCAVKPLPCDGDELIDRCIRECIDVGLIRADDTIVARNQVDMPYAYVVYDMERKQSVKTIRDWLETQDIVLSGRYSEWEYYNSDHAFLAGKSGRHVHRCCRASLKKIEAATSAYVRTWMNRLDLWVVLIAL